MRNRRALNDFLATVEQRAYQIARYNIGSAKNTDGAQEALDVVQDAMLKLVQSYADKPAEEWPKLFFRILQNRIMDYHRRKKWSHLLTRLLPVKMPDESAYSEDTLADPNALTPEHYAKQEQQMQLIIKTLEQLPTRQRQVVVLRLFEGESTEAVAALLSISPGSVKTHYSRGLKQLRQHQLAEETTHVTI